MREPVGINPRIDCVFKEILGNPRNSDVLLDFLSAVLQPEVPLVSVEILNPQHSPLELSARGSVLDIKAVDASGTLLQIEMQNWNTAALRERMLFNCAEMFTRQGRRGDDYSDLRPAISIWLLNQNLFSGTRYVHHSFRLYDPDNLQLFSAHLQIHALELERWRQGAQAGVGEDEKRWVEFFARAETWDTLPAHLASPPLEKAMDTLKQFKENADWYRIYGSQEDALRLQVTIENARKRTEAAYQTAQANLEHANAQLEATTTQLAVKTTQLEATTTQLEATTTQLEATTTQLEATASQLEATASQLEATASQLAEAQGALQEKEAEVQRLRAMLQPLQGKPR